MYPQAVARGGEADTLAVAYGELAAPIVEAIRELGARVDTLEAKL
ncbi:hypothetical protein [Paraburkholderia sp. SIMBA_054]